MFDSDTCTSDNLWALFRSWLDEIDANTKTVSEVRREMFKMQQAKQNADEALKTAFNTD